MSKLLIKYDGDYADEFNVYGFIVRDSDWWAAHLEKAKAYFETHDYSEHYFGTNEAMVYESFIDYQQCFIVTEITDDQVAALVSMFGVSRIGTDRVSFGHVLLIEV